MGFDATLIDAVGKYLHAGDVGRYIARGEPGAFGPNDTAITIDDLPQDPDKAIAIATYPVEDSGGTDSIVAVQLRIRGGRGDRTAAKDIADRAFDALHDLQAVDWGGIPIVRVWRQSGANLGTDGNNRQEITNNYYVQLTRTGANRRD